MKNHFCPSCGSCDFASTDDHRFSCSTCGFVFYKNVAATASVILIQDEEVMFSIRNNEPSKGLMDFPGGFVDPGETLEQALFREMREELNWRPSGYEFRYAFSCPNRYHYAGTTYNTTDAYFICKVKEKPQLEPLDDVAALCWCRLNTLNESDLAFQSVRAAVKKMSEMDL